MINAYFYGWILFIIHIKVVVLKVKNGGYGEFEVSNHKVTDFKSAAYTFRHRAIDKGCTVRFLVTIHVRDIIFNLFFKNKLTSTSLHLSFRAQ